MNAVNDAELFGLSQSDGECDAGPQTVAGFASAILAGPADEAGQALTFTVTNNTNPGLFLVAPSIAPNGTLTYTGGLNANGSATITVQLGDDGGTANSGVNTSPTQTFTITVTSVNDAQLHARRKSDGVV